MNLINKKNICLYLLVILAMGCERRTTQEIEESKAAKRDYIANLESVYGPGVTGTIPIPDCFGKPTIMTLSKHGDEFIVFSGKDSDECQDVRGGRLYIGGWRSGRISIKVFTRQK